MDLYIPNPRWEAPELLRPRQKPVGAVEIDWSNSLAQKLQMLFALTEGAGDARCLVTGTPGVLGGRAPAPNAEWEIIDGTRVVRMLGDTASGWIQVNGYPQIQGTVGTFFAYYPRTGPQDVFGAVVFGDAAAGCFFNMGGTADDYVFSELVEGVSQSADLFDNTNVFLACGSGPLGKFVYLQSDDHPLSVNSDSFPASSTPFPAGNKEILIGNWGGGDNWEMDADHAIFGYAERGWSVTDFNNFVRNPYQMLIPK